MINLNTPELQFAISTVRQASLLVREVQKEMVTGALTKGDRSPVTVADYAAQALTGKLLRDAFPADPLIGEEDSSALRTPENTETLASITQFIRSVLPEATPELVCEWIDIGNAESGARYWTVDPIDGTKGFLRGDQFAVALALVEDGQIQVGVLGCPNLAEAHTPDIGGPGSLVIAVRGQGTWTTPLTGTEFTRIHVSSRTDASQARLLRSFESAHTNTGQIGELVTALDVQADPVPMDSQAKYAVMAAGRGDALVRLLHPKEQGYREKIWDQAAGAIVVEEAGGRVSDLDGKPLDFTLGRTLAQNRGVLATNGSLHDAFLAGLKEVGA